MAATSPLRVALALSNWAAWVLVLCGLASLQATCWSDNVAGTNSRKLLQNVDIVLDALVASCVKTYRFQWWGWALQTAYLAALSGRALSPRNADAGTGPGPVGIHLIGATSTVLAMFFANDNLKAMDDADGTLFSRLTLTFVGFILVALFNFVNFIGHDCVARAACTGSCGQAAAASGAGKAEPATTAAASEVVAHTA